MTSFTEAVFNSSMCPVFPSDDCGNDNCAFFVPAAVFFEKQGKEVALLALKVSLLQAIFRIISIFPTGRWHASQVARDQPAKFAVIEGCGNQAKAPLRFGTPTVDKKLKNTTGG